MGVSMRSNDYGWEAPYDDDWVDPPSLHGDDMGPDDGSVDGDGGNGDEDGDCMRWSTGDGGSDAMSDGDGPGDWLDS